MELKNSFKVFFPIKFFVDKIPAIGRPIRQDIKRAPIETFNDNQIISYKFESKEVIRFSESRKTPTS